MRWIVICILACTALGQEFEVVSVKPNKSLSGNPDSDTDQGRLTATNESLRSLIRMAYGVKDYQLEGPDWLRSERYDIAAKFPEALPKGEKGNEELRAMMRNMLLDRFKLAVHREQRNYSVYGLVVGKGGVKFKESPGCESHHQRSGDKHYEGTCVSMDSFAEFLANRKSLPAEMPVLDMTGLKGFYNLTLDWIPEQAAADNPSGPTLLNAIQEQLGLKVDTRKAPIEILVVDHAEKIPTAN